MGIIYYRSLFKKKITHVPKLWCSDTFFFYDDTWLIRILLSKKLDGIIANEKPILLDEG
jgi:hypothetical protein